MYPPRGQSRCRRILGVEPFPVTGLCPPSLPALPGHRRAEVASSGQLIGNVPTTGFFLPSCFFSHPCGWLHLHRHVSADNYVAINPVCLAASHDGDLLQIPTASGAHRLLPHVGGEGAPDGSPRCHSSTGARLYPWGSGLSAVPSPLPVATPPVIDCSQDGPIARAPLPGQDNAVVMR